MRDNHRHKQGFIIFSLFALLVMLSGCVTTGEKEERTSVYKGQFTLYLNVPDTSLFDVTFTLSAVNAVTEEGVSREIMDTPTVIDSTSLAGDQVSLGEGVLPEGNYKKLRLLVREASITKKGRVASLALPSEGIEVDINISIKRHQNTTLFLNWNADASVHDDYLFDPVFTVKGKSPELGSLLIYVTNEDADNVSVINRQTAEIAATVMVQDRPRGISVSEAGERLKVYVANSGSGSISVIDPTTNSIDNEIPIRFGREPVDVAVARVSPGKDLLFVANFGSNNVSIVDASTFQEIEKVDVGRGPIAIEADPPVSELSGSKFLSFQDESVLRSYRQNYINVYVANHDSNEVSILRINTRTSRSEEVITLKVEWRPVALEVDYKRGKVYVANYGSDKLSVIDIPETVKGNVSSAVSTINNLGIGIIGVISDPTFDRLYLLKETPGEIVIIRPFSEGFDSMRTIMPPVMGIIRVGNMPRSFILDPEGRKLYVVNRGSDTISVVDKTTKKEDQLIPVGRNPYGIAVFQR